MKTNLALGVSLLSRLAAKGRQAVRGHASNAIHCRHMYSSQVVKRGTEACNSIGSTTGSSKRQVYILPGRQTAWQLWGSMIRADIIDEVLICLTSAKMTTSEALSYHPNNSARGRVFHFVNCEQILIQD